VALQVFLGLVLFTVLIGLIVAARRAQVATWERVRASYDWRFPSTIHAAAGVSAFLVVGALAVGAGWLLGWATSS
jgi:ABC-type antimicrobial peptide transport system permease subunit